MPEKNTINTFHTLNAPSGSIKKYIIYKVSKKNRWINIIKVIITMNALIFLLNYRPATEKFSGWPVKYRLTGGGGTMPVKTGSGGGLNSGTLFSHHRTDNLIHLKNLYFCGKFGRPGVKVTGKRTYLI